MGTLLTTAPAAAGLRAAPRLTANYAARYGAALCGAVIVALFYRPWVTASLAGVGTMPLSGIELARGDAASRVDRALFDPATGARPIATAGAAPGAAPEVVVSGGLVMPTRVPTVAPGTTGEFTSGRAALPALPALPAPAKPAPAGATAPTPAALSVPPPAAALPQFSLYLVLVAGIGLTIFPIAWQYQHTSRDRRFGTLWLLVLSYGGTLFVGGLVRTIVTAPPDNTLIGRGVGGVIATEPALWALLVAFAASAALVSLAWRTPAPPPNARRTRRAA